MLKTLKFVETNVCPGNLAAAGSNYPMKAHRSIQGTNPKADCKTKIGNNFLISAE